MERSRKNGESETGVTRRNVVGGVAGLAATLFAVAPRAFAQGAPKKAPNPEEQDQAPRHINRILTDQIKKEGTVTLTPPVIAEVRNFHERDYSSASGTRLLNDAFSRLNAQVEGGSTYLEKIRGIYATAQVPEWCLYNAIIESEFKPDAVGVGANPDAGAFQISNSMGRRLGLITEKDGKTVDLRFDPIASARVASRILRESYERNVKAGCDESLAWALAMHQYNGGQATDFLAYSKDQKTSRSYSDFVTHMWVFMVHKLDAAIEYRQKPGDTLETLLKKYGVNEQEFVKVNMQKIERNQNGSFRLKSYDKEKACIFTIPPLSHAAYKVNPAHALVRLGHIPTNVMYLPKLQGLLRVLRSRGVVKDIPKEL